MSYVSDRFAAILDANDLYPSLKRDVVLSFAASGLFRPRWSAEIMAEWSSRLLTRRPELGENIARTVEHMNQAFPEAPIEGYERLIEALELPDPNDRHVLAAAIKGGAHVIVTENTRDFPEAALRPFEIEIQTTDEFLLSTFELHPNAAEGP